MWIQAATPPSPAMTGVGARFSPAAAHPQLAECSAEASKYDSFDKVTTPIDAAIIRQDQGRGSVFTGRHDTPDWIFTARDWCGIPRSSTLDPTEFVHFQRGGERHRQVQGRRPGSQVMRAEPPLLPRTGSSRVEDQALPSLPSHRCHQSLPPRLWPLPCTTMAEGGRKGAAAGPPSRTQRDPRRCHVARALPDGGRERGGGGGGRDTMGRGSPGAHGAAARGSREG